MEPESKLIDVAGVILAGGKGRRMGHEKARVMLSGRPLVHHVSERASKVFEKVYVSGPLDVYPVGLPVIPDLFRDAGPLSGILSGLKAAGTPWIFVLPCDSPFIPESFLWGMASLRNDHDVVVPKIGDFYEPLHALYSIRLIPAIEKLISSGERKITSFYETARVKEVGPDLIREWDREGMAFFNVNTPKDLARAEDYVSGFSFDRDG